MGLFFDYDLYNMLRVSLSALFIYFLIIVYVRILGNRSTSQLNNFDWIVTVCVGSIIASTVVLEDVSVVEGGVSVLVLFISQYIVTKSMPSFQWLQKIVKSTPQLLLFEGEFLEDNMRAQRMMRSEVYSAIRQSGYKSIDQIYAVVLENNSKISVIPNDNSDEIGFSLSDVQGLPDGLKEDLKKREEQDDTSRED